MEKRRGRLLPGGNDRCVGEQAREREFSEEEGIYLHACAHNGACAPRVQARAGYPGGDKWRARARAHVYRGEGERINRKREMVICVYRE